MLESEPVKEEGEVIAINGNMATVRMKAKKGCDGCSLCTRVSETEMIVDAMIQKPVNIGDRVSVIIKPGTIVKIAFILYMFPIMGLIGGYYFGRFFESLVHAQNRGELLPALFGILFLVLCFIPIRVIDRWRKKKNKVDVLIGS
jgi:sigma-E factor negative regulatory protein RseC